MAGSGEVQLKDKDARRREVCCLCETRWTREWVCRVCEAELEASLGG